MLRPQLGPGHASEHRAGDRDGAEHADQHTDDQDEREALDDRRPLPVEPAGDEEARDVRVEDARPGSVEPGLDRRAEGLAGADLLLHPLEDEDVRVDRHADREDEGGDAGQRQRDVDDPEDRVDDERVEDQRDRRQHARQAVVGDHEDEDEQQAHAAGDAAPARGSRRRASGSHGRRRPARSARPAARRSAACCRARSAPPRSPASAAPTVMIVWPPQIALLDVRGGDDLAVEGDRSRAGRRSPTVKSHQMSLASSLSVNWTPDDVAVDRRRDARDVDLAAVEQDADRPVLDEAGRCPGPSVSVAGPADR